MVRLDRVPPSTVAQRVFAYKKAGELDLEFAKRLGLNPQTVSMWRTNTKTVSPAILELLHDKLNANLNWVIAEGGDMYRQPISDVEGKLMKARRSASKARELIAEAEKVLGS